MALLTSSGFDVAGYGVDADLYPEGNGWWVTSGDPGTQVVYDTTGGNFSGGCVKLLADSTYPQLRRRFLKPISSELIRLAFYVYVPTGYTCGALDPLIWLQNVDGNAFWILYISGGKLVVADTRTSKAVGGETSTTTVQDDAWHHIEVEFFRNASTGYVKCWIDGTLDINSTSINTGSVSLIGMDTLNIGNSRSSGSVADFVRFDDIVLWDDEGVVGFKGQIGQHRIYGLTVDGAGGSSQFTPSAGSNYQNVDEQSNDFDSTYNESSTNGHKDLYTYTALGDISATAYPNVWAVVVRTSVRQTSIGTASVKSIISDGTVEVKSDSWSLQVMPKEFEFYTTYDPGTDALWVDTDIADLQCGVELTI